MKIVLAAIASSLAVAGYASAANSTTLGAEEHAAHHPAGAAPTPAEVDEKMKMMHSMHQKMAEAKTPEERTALMKDHMKAMREGMAMMGRMHGGMSMGGTAAGNGHMSMNHDAMKRRMDMMEMMMQMMMDRDDMNNPAPK
jgi:hypothetical protein